MNNPGIKTEKQQSPLDRLQILLEKQLSMLKCNNLRGLESLLEQVNAVLDEIAQNPSSWQPENEEKIGIIQEIYKKLELMIESEKAAANKQLQKIANGQKTLRAYHR